MSTLKRSKLETSNDAALHVARHPAAEAPAKAAARITALELSADSDEGGDPYNRTGQFLVEHIRKYEE